MSAGTVDFDISLSKQFRIEDLQLVDLEAIRLILRGGSLIDWYRPNFKNREHVANFLKVNGFSLGADLDDARIRYLLQTSGEYLLDAFSYSLPSELLNPEKIEDVFLIAAKRHHPHQKLACMLLKVVQVLNHLQGRELGHLLSVSDQSLFSLAEVKVEEAVETMRLADVGIVRYETSRKSRNSLVTKLLSKRRTIAAQIFDKLRFRIITKSRTDIVPTLLHMTRSLFPFNYVVPEESRNDLVNIRVLAESTIHLQNELHQLQFDLGLEEKVHSNGFLPNISINPASADSYQVINFVVDMPLRADKLMADLKVTPSAETGFLVFVLVEFQILDEETYIANESGAASHARYKERQRQQVLRRLVQGMPMSFRRDSTPKETVSTNEDPADPEENA